MTPGSTKNLFAAIEDGDLHRCERAIIAGADTAFLRGNPVNASVERPMDVAARLGHLSLVDLLFCHGAPLNADEYGGTRALVIAQLTGNQDVEAYLRNCGAADGLLIGLCFTSNIDGVNAILDADPFRWPHYSIGCGSERECGNAGGQSPPQPAYYARSRRIRAGPKLHFPVAARA